MIDQDLESDEIERLIDAFLERFRRGERPSIDALCKEHPQHEAELRDLLPSLLALERVAPAQHEAEQRRQEKLPLKQMGDYRLLRIIGRGGMGTVYEAEQASLGRRVALKILANAANAPRLAKRFEREARAVAHLHHSNIVPIFAVGEFDGSLFYAMQLIHGQGLDAVLSELRRMWKSWRRTQGRPDLPDEPNEDTDSMDRGNPQSAIIASSLVSEASSSGEFKSDSRSDAFNGANSISTILNITPKSGFDTTEYFRRIARIGLQAAEALDYAHSQNVLHRDVKPGNLLLDVRGAVWLTDFGLAKILDDEDLTATGDRLGTLRYLAPENFSGKATARSDVYSLGLTLYELVTLRPAFTERRRSDLINRITSGDLPRVREANPDAPRDLETVILKAIEVDPKHRYPSADALASDLRRFINDEPIQARPPRTGCGKAVLFNNLMERDSNEMMAVLIRAGVSCEKVQGEEDRWQITVAHADFARAVDELKKYGLPRDRFVNIGDVFKKSGLVSSPTEERVRFMHAVSQELSDTISQIDGVVSARVHLVLPNNNAFGEQTRASSASVFIRHRPNARLEGSIPDVNRIVMNAVEGLKYENVTTVLSPAEEPPASAAAGSPVDTVQVMSMQVGSKSLAQFWTLLGNLAGLSVVSIGALALVLLRRRPAMAPALVRP